jgi:hypothetical protein
LEDRINQTKEIYAFALADELLGYLEAQSAAKRVSSEKVGSVRLDPPDFVDVIGGHCFDSAGNTVPSIQRWWLQAV